MRVKQHIKGNNKNTINFCKSLGISGKVDLYLLPNPTLIPSGISNKEFLCVLEQYLIFKYKPKINKSYVARPGII